MISAMKLPKNKYLLSSLYIDGGEGEDSDQKHRVFEEIALFKPKVIITLGGRVSMNMLETTKRLQSIHGQFFDLNLSLNSGEKLKTKIIPMFSPSFINEAPNTKRIAWEDMQKVMKELHIDS
jgi:uracil-DNA glycosylase family 4